MSKPSTYNKDWTEGLASRLEGLEQTPPEGLWEGIAAGVPALSGKAKRRRLIPLWGWYAAASLAAASLVAGVLLYPSVPGDERVEIVAVESGQNIAVVDSTEAEESLPEEAQETEPVKVLRQSKETAKQAYVEPVKEPEEPQVVVIEQEESKPVTEPSSLPEEDMVIFVNEDDHNPSASLPAKHVTRLGISSGQYLAFNGTTTNTGFGIPSTPRMMAPGKGGVSPMMVARNQHSTTESRHAIPYRFGATLEYGFSPRWSLESGLFVTLLDSRFTTTSGITEAVTNRRSAYLGIPLSLHYKAWEWKRLSLYGAIGGEYDHAVRSWATHTTTSGGHVIEETKDRDLVKDHSWSLNLSGGAQLLLFEQGLLFVQPGVSWHIPRGDDAPETAFTAHPLTPELTFGIRIKL